MYTGKSCTEFNIRTGIPPCSEYPLGDCGRCPNWENAIQYMRPRLSTGHYMYAVRAPSFRVRIAFSRVGQRAQTRNSR